MRRQLAEQFQRDIDLDGSNGKSATLSNNIELKQIELGQLPAVKEKELTNWR